MSRWWRAYDEALQDPKLLALSDKQHRAWFNLLCIASKNSGTLPAIATVAIELRVTVARAAEYVTVMVTMGLFDEIETGKFAPHNWNARQYKSDVSTERVKRFRKRDGNVSSDVTRNVSETPPETERTETETDSETSSLRSEDARARDSGRQQFDEFWKLYPHKVAKKAAYKAFVKAGKSGAITFDRMIFALTAYINKTDDRPWCNPATWLNEGRWDDQPAPEVRNGRSLLAAAQRQTERLGGRGAASAYVPGSEKPQPLSLDFGEKPPDIQRLPPR